MPVDFHEIRSGSERLGRVPTKKRAGFQLHQNPSHTRLPKKWKPKNWVGSFAESESEESELFHFDTDSVSVVYDNWKLKYPAEAESVAQVNSQS